MQQSRTRLLLVWQLFRVRPADLGRSPPNRNSTGCVETMNAESTEIPVPNARPRLHKLRLVMVCLVLLIIAGDTGCGLPSVFFKLIPPTGLSAIP